MPAPMITGWGKCLPPAVLSNADLETLTDTSDEWIVTRTGIKERRISHVETSDLAAVAGPPGPGRRRAGARRRSISSSWPPAPPTVSSLAPPPWCSARSGPPGPRPWTSTPPAPASSTGWR